MDEAAVLYTISARYMNEKVLFHDVILQIRLIPAIQSFWLITKAEGRQLPYEEPPLSDSVFAF